MRKDHYVDDGQRNWLALLTEDDLEYSDCGECSSACPKQHLDGVVVVDEIVVLIGGRLEHCLHGEN